jgi:hypothetical protein
VSFWFQLTFEITRCSLSDRSQCSRENDLTFSDVCAFAEQSQAITGFLMTPVNVVEPPLECPIQKKVNSWISVSSVKQA